MSFSKQLNLYQNIVVLQLTIFKILKYSGLLPFSVLPRCHCVYTHQAGRKPALQQKWQSSEKSQNFQEKTQFLMNTLYISIQGVKEIV